MAIYHLEAKVISRGCGRSAVAASAYMSCSRMYNDYDGIQHDYTRKLGLIHQEVLLPPTAPSEWADREKLWNAVEGSEKTKDSRLAREFVAALPIELNKDTWLDLLYQFIQKEFVDIGMCADFSIHDIDGHNPHAHIMLTIRPLNENGTWQHKTEKEYLCSKDGIEQGFTAAEFKEAQKEGWEKQYPYKVGKKKIYMTPSEAQIHGYERASKYPKSTKFGRQNPISKQWNSEEQLLVWRERWAEIVNHELKIHGINAQIDHRSFADQGIAEQPTIHEGYIARDMEQNSFVSERCEINRQIQADNRLIRDLKRQVDKLAKAVTESISSIAETLEFIRQRMIMLQYHLLHNRMQTSTLSEKINIATPIMTEYRSVKNQIKEKIAEKKELNTKKSNTSIFSPIQHIQLNQNIAAITEEIEEMKSRKAQLMWQISCQNETEMNEAERILSQMNIQLEKLEVQHDSLESQISDDALHFADVKSKANSSQDLALLDERLTIREIYIEKLLSKLHEVFGQKFNFQRFHAATSQIDDRLTENPDIFLERSLYLQHNQKQNSYNNLTSKHKNNIYAYER